jgi:hypothetical protein
MDSEQDWVTPDIENLPDYIANRARILSKTYDDHLAWDQALNASTNRFGLSRRWVASDGTKRTVVITRPYMTIHWKILRSVILDLAECGEEGLDVLRALLTVSEGT